MHCQVLQNSGTIATVESHYGQCTGCECLSRALWDIIRGWLEFQEGWPAVDEGSKGGSEWEPLFHSMSEIAEISTSRDEQA